MKQKWKTFHLTYRQIKLNIELPHSWAVCKFHQLYSDCQLTYYFYYYVKGMYKSEINRKLV